MSLFPAPVSGQPIPRGWFARLVRFMNSLILRGDETYLSVKHTAEGTLIRPTNYLIEQLTKSGGTPGGSGANQDISATVSSDGTATVALSGSTSAVEFIGTGDVTLSGNTNGQIEIGCTGGGGGGSSGFMPPDYENAVLSGIAIDTIYQYAFPVWAVGTIGVSTLSYGEVWGGLTFYDAADSETTGIGLFRGGAANQYSPYNLEIPVSVWIPAGQKFAITSTQGGTATDLVCAVALYRCRSQVLANYTVTQSTGTSPGSLFYGLSQQGDNTVSVDPSLNGTPIDFEGASVL